MFFFVSKGLEICQKHEPKNGLNVLDDVLFFPNAFVKGDVDFLHFVWRQKPRKKNTSNTFHTFGPQKHENEGFKPSKYGL